jgi:hypothetical protein
MSLGGFAPAPEFVFREARAAGPMAEGVYRVISCNHHIAHADFTTLEEARRHADDVASESDYEDIPPAAYVLDSSFECIDIGIHFGVRQPGKTAWESYQLSKG